MKKIIDAMCLSFLVCLFLGWIPVFIWYGVDKLISDNSRSKNITREQTFEMLDSLWVAINDTSTIPFIKSVSLERFAKIDKFKSTMPSLKLHDKTRDLFREVLGWEHIAHNDDGDDLFVNVGTKVRRETEGGNKTIRHLARIIPSDTLTKKLF
jgi:hypothetical protein